MRDSSRDALRGVWRNERRPRRNARRRQKVKDMWPELALAIEHLLEGWPESYARAVCAHPGCPRFSWAQTAVDLEYAMTHGGTGVRRTKNGPPACATHAATFGGWVS